MPLFRAVGVTVVVDCGGGGGVRCAGGVDGGVSVGVGVVCGGDGGGGVAVIFVTSAIVIDSTELESFLVLRQSFKNSSSYKISFTVQ